MTSTGRSVGGPATDVVAYALVIAAAVAWGTVGFAFTGIARVPAPRAALTLLLEPVTAAVLAADLLGERLAPSGLLGDALVLVAVAIVGRSPRSVGRTMA